jgi:tetratricopeptide (TPR) repeat protein
MVFSLVVLLIQSWSNAIVMSIIYLLSLVIPTTLIVLEKFGVSYQEWLNIVIAKILISLKKSQKAKQILQKTVRNYNKNFTAYKMLAKIYEEDGALRKSIIYYCKALEIKQEDYTLQYKIATMLIAINKNEQAIKILNNIVLKKADYIEPYFTLADLYYSKKMYKEVINIYKFALEHKQNSYEIYYNSAITYALLNDFNNAKEYFKKAVENNSNLVNANYFLGQISLLYRDIDLAEEHFIEVTSGDLVAKACFELSKIYLLKDNKAKAAECVNKAIDIDAKYVKIIKEEPIFMLIKRDLNLVTIPKEETKSTLNYKEIDVIEHLNNTYDLTKSLTVNEILNKLNEEPKVELERKVV